MKDESILIAGLAVALYTHDLQASHHHHSPHVPEEHFPAVLIKEPEISCTGNFNGFCPGWSTQEVVPWEIPSGLYQVTEYRL